MSPIALLLATIVSVFSPAAKSADKNILIIGDSQAGATAARVREVQGPDENVSVRYKVGSNIEFWSAGGQAKRALVELPFPQVVIVFLGTNNYWNSTLPDVGPILGEIRASQAKCVWVGPTKVKGKTPAINAKLKAAVEPTCTYVDSQDIPLADGIHPTWQGVLTWLKAIWSVK